MNSTNEALSAVTLANIAKLTGLTEKVDASVSGFDKLKSKLGFSRRAKQQFEVQNVRIQVSLWLTCYRNPEEEVQLWLHYEDQTKHANVLVDSQTLHRGHSLMFEGTVDLDVEGKLQELSLKSTGMTKEIPFKVEDFTVRKV